VRKEGCFDLSYQSTTKRGEGLSKGGKKGGMGEREIDMEGTGKRKEGTNLDTSDAKRKKDPKDGYLMDASTMVIKTRQGESTPTKAATRPSVRLRDGIRKALGKHRAERNRAIARKDEHFEKE